MPTTYFRKLSSKHGPRSTISAATLSCRRGLYKIAINESLSFLARERRRNNLSIDDDESMLINAIQADTNIDGDALALELRKAIASLPEKQRLVFNMRYYDEMKYEQMAEILGTSVGALKSSYHLAVKKIEQYFSQFD